MKKDKALKILNILEDIYPLAKAQLNFSTPFELLVAVILSAQCTDKRVNVVTKELFKLYNTPQSLSEIDQAELEKIIFSCGFYHNKAKHIISASKSIMLNFSGHVPDNLEDLRSLDGVGRKTANVVYSVAFGKDAIAVDTHVFRVSNRVGLADSKNVLNTELQLMENIPKNIWSKSHHLLIFHGRNICKARPLCNDCLINYYCDYFNILSKDKKIKK